MKKIMKLKICFAGAAGVEAPNIKIVRARIPRANCIRLAFPKMALTGRVSFSGQGSE